MPVDEIPLPEFKHLPGINSRPTDGFIEQIAQLAKTVTDDAGAEDNIALLYGVRLINHGYFWEAHETLETVWMRATPNSRERFLVQCLIQIANAALKQALDRPKAAERLCDIAMECRLRALPGGTAQLMGFNVADLDDAIAQCRQFTGRIRLVSQYI